MDNVKFKERENIWVSFPAPIEIFTAAWLACIKKMICNSIYVAVMLKVVNVVTLIESLYGDSSWRLVAVLSGRNEMSP
jgi:hypothetical protein